MVLHFFVPYMAHDSHATRTASEIDPRSHLLPRTPDPGITPSFTLETITPTRLEKNLQNSKTLQVVSTFTTIPDFLFTDGSAFRVLGFVDEFWGRKRAALSFIEKTVQEFMPMNEWKEDDEQLIDDWEKMTKSWETKARENLESWKGNPEINKNEVQEKENKLENTMNMLRLAVHTQRELRGSFIRDQTTGKRYRNESTTRIRLKCAGLVFATLFIQPFFLLSIMIGKIVSLVLFLPFWRVLFDKSYPFKAAVGDTAKNLLKIIAFPLAFVGLELSAIYGIFRPYDGRKVYSAIQGAYAGWNNCQFVQCFKPYNDIEDI
jgi:hypothetical protein